MRRTSPIAFRVVTSAVLAAAALIGCTEDPTLDLVGGTGSVTDARPKCAATEPDARPRFLPCDVEAVLRAKCQRCHDTDDALTPCFVAKTCVKGPFPLLTWSDTHRLFGTTPIFELMRNAVASGYMPFQEADISPPAEKLTSEEKAILVAWTTGCAPSGTKVCDSAGDAAVDAR